MTVLSLLRPGGRQIQRIIFGLGTLEPPAQIEDLQMIHFARLAIIRRFPDHGQRPDDLRQPLQLFESNYNGSFGQYLDTFVDRVPGKMRAFWGTSYGFPWCLRFGAFNRYVEANEFRIDHYYVRHPEVTVRMVASAMRVRRVNAELAREAPRLDPGAFASRLRTAVTALQDDL